MPEQTITPEHNEVRITRSFQAPLAAVWETWTSADDFTVWFGAKPGSVELDVTPGGCWQAMMETPAATSRCRAATATSSSMRGSGGRSTSAPSRS